MFPVESPKLHRGMFYLFICFINRKTAKNAQSFYQENRRKCTQKQYHKSGTYRF